MEVPPPFDPEAFKRFEHQGWVEVAPAYAGAFSELTLEAVEPLLAAAGVGAGVRLLDVASGPGFVAGAAAARGAAAIGLDFSATMVAEARRRFPAVEFHEGDAEALPFEAGAFDAVTMGFGMLHLARPERAIAEAHRVLRPGGRYAFTVWDAPEQAVMFGLVLQAVEARGRAEVGLPAGPPFFRFSDSEECRRDSRESKRARSRSRSAWRRPTPCSSDS